MPKFNLRYLVQVDGGWLYYVAVGRGGAYTLITKPYTYDAADAKSEANAIAIAKHIGGKPFRLDPLTGKIEEIQMEE